MRVRSASSTVTYSVWLQSFSVAELKSGSRPSRLTRFSSPHPVLEVLVGVLLERRGDLRMVQASSGDRVLAITEIADDLGDDDFVEDTDQPVDVDLVADGEGTGLHVAAGPAPLGPSCRHD
jgi:hypothetical protein